MTPAAAASASTLPMRPTREGLAFTHRANDNYYTFPAISLSVPFTIAWWGEKQHPTQPEFVVQFSGATATAAWYGPTISLGASGAWFAQYGDGTGSSSTSYRRAASSTTLTTWTLTHLVAVCRSATDWSLFQDGVAVSSPTYSGTGGSMANHSGGGALGRGNATYNAPEAATLDLRVWDRDFTDAEALSLYDPQMRWDLYRPAIDHPWVMLLGGGAVASRFKSFGLLGVN